MSLELEFVYVLVLKEIDAVENSNAAIAGRCRSKQASFLNNHLGSWVSQFADAVQTHAQTGFYRALAHATRSLVMQDLQEFCDTPSSSSPELAPDEREAHRLGPNGGQN